MADAATLDAIRRVEEAPLDQLVNISFEDVQSHMDALLEPGNDAASFFLRWETQQWAASTLDFERDRRDWANLPPRPVGAPTMAPATTRGSPCAVARR